MVRRKSNFVNAVMRDLDRTSKYLTEDYIFNDEDNQGYPQEDAYDDRQEPNMQRDNMPNDYQHEPSQGDENAEEKAMHVHEVIQHEPIIQKIRQTAIDGLKKYAEDPTSSIYEFFKKVFLESDKVLTDDGNSSNGK